MNSNNQFQEIALTDLVLDPRLQMREAGLDLAVVDEYAECIDDLPPVNAIRNADGTQWLTGGWHRYHAHKKAGRQKIKCVVRPGTWLDAIAEAAGSNAKHGIRRTGADKRRAVMALLTEPTWAGRSDRMIAEAAHVSNHLVSQLRRDISVGNYPNTRTGVDGKSYKRTKSKSEIPADCAAKFYAAQYKPVMPANWQ
ncbi:MAG TPA: hypothetical protein VFE62_07490, partial [Gemmataceae bacterium]|nr:hypothetical protein [Gemmataceae bacterium]